MIKLSNRLKHIAQYIPKGCRFADIGSDHAYLCSYVCLNDPAAFAIAGEIRKGPLMSAKKTVASHQLENNISVRLGDGLDVIHHSDKIETIVIAGMGGKLISAILHKKIQQLPTIKKLILQPNTNPEIIREFLIESEFSLTKEELVEENNHIYEILVAEKNCDIHVYDPYVTMEKQLFFGPILMKERTAVFKKKWLREYKHLSQIIKQMENSQVEHKTKELLEKRRLWMEELLS